MASISGKTDPVVRRISATDVTDALGKGLRDFQAMPIYGMLLGAMFAGGGSMAVLTTTAFGMSYLSYPLAAGFVLIGNIVGSVLSLVLFSLTVVSFPLLLDRDVDFITAMITSVRAVVMSPLPMIGWAAVIVVLMIVSCLPYFLGLVVTLPILGHTTWHLYRRIVAPVDKG